MNAKYGLRQPGAWIELETESQVSEALNHGMLLSTDAAAAIDTLLEAGRHWPMHRQPRRSRR